jgi:hypothetical protein
MITAMAIAVVLITMLTIIPMRSTVVLTTKLPAM